MCRPSSHRHGSLTVAASTPLRIKATMILVVGSTGLLGSAISLKLAREGKVVAGLVRDVSSAKARTLRDGGVTLVSGNLTQPHTLEAALAQVEAIICTATAILSSGPSNT